MSSLTVGEILAGMMILKVENADRMHLVYLEMSIIQFPFHQ